MSPRVTRRGWIALATAGTVLVGSLVLGYRVLSGSNACEVTVDGDRVSLGRGTAERAATALAPLAGRSITAGARELTRRAIVSSGDAPVVAAALVGRRAAALTCRGGGSPDAASDRLGSDGLTARAERVRRDVEKAFGAQSLGGFAPGGVTTGHMPGSAHYEGRAIDVFFRPIKPANKRLGWAMAQYLVAHADRLEVDTVIFDGRIWTARRSASGWRDYAVSAAGKPASVVRILEHRDHVHVDVAD